MWFTALLLSLCSLPSSCLRVVHGPIIVSFTAYQAPVYVWFMGLFLSLCRLSSSCLRVVHGSVLVSLQITKLLSTCGSWVCSCLFGAYQAPAYVWFMGLFVSLCSLPSPCLRVVHGSVIVSLQITKLLSTCGSWVCSCLFAAYQAPAYVWFMGLFLSLCRLPSPCLRVVHGSVRVSLQLTKPLPTCGSWVCSCLFAAYQAPAYVWFMGLFLSLWNLPSFCLRVVHGSVIVSLQITKLLSTCGSWVCSCLFAAYQASVYVWFMGLFVSLCSLPSFCLRVVHGSVRVSLQLTKPLPTCGSWVCSCLFAAYQAPAYVWFMGLFVSLCSLPSPCLRVVHVSVLVSLELTKPLPTCGSWVCSCLFAAYQAPAYVWFMGLFLSLCRLPSPCLRVVHGSVLVSLELTKPLPTCGSWVCSCLFGAYQAPAYVWFMGLFLSLCRLPSSCLRVVHGSVLVSLQITKLLPTCGSWVCSCLFADYQAPVYVWFMGLFVSLCSLPRSCLRVVHGSVLVSLQITKPLSTCGSWVCSCLFAAYQAPAYVWFMGLFVSLCSLPSFCQRVVHGSVRVSLQLTKPLPTCGSWVCSCLFAAYQAPAYVWFMGLFVSLCSLPSPCLRVVHVSVLVSLELTKPLPACGSWVCSCLFAAYQAPAYVWFMGLFLSLCRLPSPCLRVVHGSVLVSLQLTKPLPTCGSWVCSCLFGAYQAPAYVWFMGLFLSLCRLPSSCLRVVHGSVLVSLQITKLLPTCGSWVCSCLFAAYQAPAYVWFMGLFLSLCRLPSPCLRVVHGSVRVSLQLTKPLPTCGSWVCSCLFAAYQAPAYVWFMGLFLSHWSLPSFCLRVVHGSVLVSLQLTKLLPTYVWVMGILLTLCSLPSPCLRVVHGSVLVSLELTKLLPTCGSWVCSCLFGAYQAPAYVWFMGLFLSLWSLPSFCLRVVHGLVLVSLQLTKPLPTCGSWVCSCLFGAYQASAYVWFMGLLLSLFSLPSSCLRVVHGSVLVSLDLTKPLPTCGSWACSCLFAAYQAPAYLWFKGLFLSLWSLPSPCLRVVHGSVLVSLELTKPLLTCGSCVCSCLFGAYQTSAYLWFMGLFLSLWSLPSSCLRVVHGSVLVSLELTKLLPTCGSWVCSCIFGAYQASAYVWFMGLFLSLCSLPSSCLRVVHGHIIDSLQLTKLLPTCGSWVCSCLFGAYQAPAYVWFTGILLTLCSLPSSCLRVVHGHIIDSLQLTKLLLTCGSWVCSCLFAAYQAPAYVWFMGLFLRAAALTLVLLIAPYRTLIYNWRKYHVLVRCC